MYANETFPLLLTTDMPQKCIIMQLGVANVAFCNLTFYSDSLAKSGRLVGSFAFHPYRATLFSVVRCRRAVVPSAVLLATCCRHPANV